LGEFELWNGDVRDAFVVDFFRDLGQVADGPADAEPADASGDWLLSALTV
jgi:hypothetical protein